MTTDQGLNLRKIYIVYIPLVYMTKKFTDYDAFVEHVGERLLRFDPKDDMPSLRTYSVECRLEDVMGGAAGTDATRVYSYNWGGMAIPSAICTIKGVNLDIGTNLEKMVVASTKKVWVDILDVARQRNKLFVGDGTAKSFTVVENWPEDPSSVYGLNPHHLGCNQQ